MSRFDNVSIVCLVKNKERYIFMFDEVSRLECLRVVGRWASCQDLSLTWYDAAMLSQRIRAEATAS